MFFARIYHFFFSTPPSSPIDSLFERSTIVFVAGTIPECADMYDLDACNPPIFEELMIMNQQPCLCTLGKLLNILDTYPCSGPHHFKQPKRLLVRIRRNEVFERWDLDYLLYPYFGIRYETPVFRWDGTRFARGGNLLSYTSPEYCRANC